MHWLRSLHDQPHSLPHDCPQAGAQWTPDIQEYDRDRPLFPVMYSEEEKQEQYEAGDRLREEFDRALEEGSKSFTIPPGVYRLKEPLVLEGTEGFTLEAADVEILMESESHFRVLGNRDLTVRGPLIMDADPIGWTQGEIIDLDEEEMTIDLQLFEGYIMPTEGKRIHFFTPEGQMLPHGQDVVQECTDLGDHKLRIKMNPWTWGMHVDHADEILKCGNLMAIEGEAKGGLEMRDNTNLTFEDVSMHTHGHKWAMPEFGDDTFVRWIGTRRRDTNRLVGGGYPLMTFHGGSYSLIDSEIGHNFDDITDINTVMTFGFRQVNPRQFYITDDTAQPGWPITLHEYESMECYCECNVESLEPCTDDAVGQNFAELAEKYGVRDAEETFLCTVDCDVELPEFSFVSLIPSKAKCFRMERNYLHDGLASGVALKGAEQIIVKDNIIERVNRHGICIGFDPYWTEGNPSECVSEACRNYFPSFELTYTDVLSSKVLFSDSMNIEITGNTVRNASYNPTNDDPAITVYIGGSAAGGMPGPKTTAQLMKGVTIANNAVYSSGSVAIMVVNSQDVLIADNVITDSAVSGYAYGSIFLNAVPEGTRVVGNVFAGADASTEAVQIKVGPMTDPRSIFMENNKSANPEIPVPALPWQYHSVTEEGFDFSDEWGEEEGEFPTICRKTDEKDAAVTYPFYGSRVRVVIARGPDMGQSDIFLDGQHAETVDLSRPKEDLVTPCWTSPILPEGDHELRIVNRGERGEHTNEEEEDGGALSLVGVDVLSGGLGECH